MAFENRSSQVEDKKIVLEVVTPQDDGTSEVNKYLLNRLGSNKVVALGIKSKGDNDAAVYEMLGILFDSDEPIEGSKSLTELVSTFDEETTQEFLRYIFRISKSSIASLINEGIDVR